jgi:hypothetical protein
MRIDNPEELTSWNLKELTHNFMHIVKNSYFKKLIIEEINKNRMKKIEQY